VESILKERAILVTADFDSLSRPVDAGEASKELQELAKSAGLEVIQNLTVRQKSPNAALLIGKGKAETLGAAAKDQKADVFIFNGDLTSTQQRNLEETLGQKTVDRTQLILDIFAQRARSTEGKLQVELAQLKYLLPRLTGKGILLSRLGGGVGTRGPGEQKLEVDRRRIRERMARLSKALSQLQRRRFAGIERKKKKDLPLVALVGYTNAGKSTLFNALTHSAVQVKHRLFSTLDTTTRLLELAGNRRALLVDTVGFVRDLPHHLIESFKATLEEAARADLLLHVLDASRPDRGNLERAVQKVLEELGVEAKKQILVLNKADLLSAGDVSRLFGNASADDGVLVSSLKGSGLALLLKKIADILSFDRNVAKFFIPKERLGLLHFLYEEGEVLARRDTARGAQLTVHLSEKSERIFRSKLQARPS
jgi:GTP-binding protein HflX